MIMIVITITYIYIYMHYSFEGDLDWCLNISIDFKHDFDGCIWMLFFPRDVLKSYFTVMLFDFCCGCKLYFIILHSCFSFCWRGPIFFGGPTSHFFHTPQSCFLHSWELGWNFSEPWWPWLIFWWCWLFIGVIILFYAELGCRRNRGCAPFVCCSGWFWVVDFPNWVEQYIEQRN